MRVNIVFSLFQYEYGRIISISQIHTYMAVNLKNQKEEKRTALLRAHGLPNTTRAIVVSYVQNAGIQAFLTLACASLGVVLLHEKNETILAGADAWITDVLDTSVPVDTLLHNVVVPIVPA